MSPDEQLILGNQIQFLFDHKKIKQIQKIKVITSAVYNRGVKKFACPFIKRGIIAHTLLKLLVIKKEIILTKILCKVGFTKLIIPVILMFLKKILFSYIYQYN